MADGPTRSPHAPAAGQAGTIEARPEPGRLRPAPRPGTSTVATTKARGRLSATKLRTLAEVGPRYAIDLDPSPETDADADADADARPLGERLDASFGRRTPRLLDVGVGNGEATLAWAADHPDRDVVVAELHRPSLAILLAALEDSGIGNVRVAEADVRTLLAAAGPGAVHDVRILFPDPWPKRRHLARRLVDGPFVAGLGDVLPPGGTLHVATDWPDYAAQVVRSIEADDRFAIDPSTSRPPRPVTTYEALGRAADRPIADIVATRR